MSTTDLYLPLLWTYSLPTLVLISKPYEGIEEALFITSKFIEENKLELFDLNF